MAMLVTPAATAYLLVRSFTQMMILGAVLGATAAVAGLYISFHINVPSGPAMTLVATGIFIFVVAVRRRAPA
jgi:manganese/iron transport system permease protein